MDTILQGLNKAQQEAVCFADTPLLILAGAGSGKTKVLTHRVAYFIKNGVSPENTLLLTFTNKASEEMIKRVKILTGSANVSGGTYHSFGAKILRKYHHYLDLSPDFTIFDTDDQMDTMKQAFANLGIDPKTTKISSVLGTISSAKNELISASEYINYARGQFQELVARCYLAYQQLLKKYHALDFDDLLVKTVELLNNPEVLNKLNEIFTHILVDEYQDTNKAQFQITKLLAKKDQHLTVVGDFSQAIYSWRGADYRNMLLLKQDFPNLKTINLEQNYRSTQNILDAANNVISKNKNHPILSLWTEKSDGSKIVLYEADNEWREAEYIAENITIFSDAAVLYRTNAQSRVIEETFLQKNIPYVLIGGTRFYERKEIKDVLCYLRLLIHPGDEVSAKRAEKIGKMRLNQLLISNIQFLDKPTLEVLENVLRVTKYLELYDVDDPEDAGRLENIKELYSVASLHPNLNEFLEKIALTEKESKKTHTSEKGYVTLMTMHAAKGLEFKHVFIVGLEEGLFPHSRTLLDPTEMEEERRLAYVGITRAMDKLYLTYARSRMWFGQRNSNTISRFVSDIPESLLETSSLPTPRLRQDKWGFDESGNWQWKPED
ncbi:MAG: UvrD-helicase domain-containing protein [Candidatus Amesbacteria bacterium]|nr:UvrD-helicase domain-containing protein [Candidatus Amesbacteria bacterium]